MNAAEHAATVREALLGVENKVVTLDDEKAIEALAALVALAERATELERRLKLAEEDDGIVERHNRERAERAEADYERQREYADEQYRKALAAEARATELEAELTEWRTSIATERLTERAERAETALREARKVLEVIEEPMHFDDFEMIRDDRVRMQAAARAWLTKDRAALGETV